MGGSKSDVPALLSTVQQARQVLAASCRNHLIRIETQAISPKARKQLAPHAEALQAALDALLKPVPEEPRKPAAWEVEPQRRYKR